MKPRLTSTGILLILPAILLAQNLPYTTYTSKDGLASDRVTAITQDEQGAMWFGSYYGICRYDGQKFENIRLPVQQKDKYVSFLLASRGKIYAGFLFNGGLLEYEKGKMKSHFLPAGTGTSNTFICMTDNGDGSYLIANNTGHIYYFHDGRFTFLSNLDPSAGQVQHLQKAGNQLHVATDKGLYVLSVSGEKQATFFQGDNIIALQLRENTSWLLRLQGNTLVFDEFLKDPAKPSRQIRRPQKGIVVATRRPDMLWVLNGTDLLRIDSAGSSEYPAAVRTAANATAIFCDRENNVWLASEPGVVKISNFASQNFTTGDINPAGGGLARQNDSTLWYTNSKSLFRIVNSRITRVPDILDGMPEHYGLLHLENNHLWIVLWNGLLIRARIENDRLVTDREFVKFKGRELNVSTVVSDDMGNVWAGGINGIYHIRGGRVIGHSDLEQAGGAAFITCISLDEKNKVLWIGDNAAGVTRLAYDFLPDGTCTYKVLRHLGSREGLHDTYTRSILADQEGNVWVGTRFGGIFRIREDAGKLQVVSVNTAANLGCNRITDISAEDTNAVWFAACDGVYRYTYKDNSWRHFTTSDGLLNAEVFKLLADNNSKSAWAVTAGGVTRISAAPGPRATAPLVQLTAISVLGKPDSTALQMQKAVYDYSENSVGFHFIAPSFIDEKKIRYRYRLTGYDSDWSDPVPVNSVNYASLPPGNYVFEVTAMNARGQWSTAPARFSLRIVLPFYRRAWFLVLVFCALLYIVYLVRLQRLKHRYKIEKIRLHIARDLHDDVGATLGSINLLTKTATRKLQKETAPHDVIPIFEKIGDSAEHTLEAMDDIVWSINPEKDTLHDLVTRMREFAIPLFESRDIDFHYDIQVKEHDRIAMNLRRTIFLIYKEAVHNIVRHSHATVVNIGISCQPHSFSMSIADNGKGFDPLAPTARNGLKNMHKRSEGVKGNLEISSGDGGTRIHFQCRIG